MKQRALIDIDMILDTRLGVLTRLNSEIAKDLVRSEWYRIRATDTFEDITNGGIKDSEFKEMYEAKEVETLFSSVFTNFLFYLRDDVNEFYPKMYVYGKEIELVFEINVYPYKLLDSEKEIIKRAVARYVSFPAEVKVVDLAYHLLTPNHLNTNYDMMTLYNYEDWLKYHHESLYNNPIQDFTLFHPRIAPSGKLPDLTEDKSIRDPFMLIPMMMVKHLQVSPIDTVLACWNPDIYEIQKVKVGETNPSE